MTFHYNTKLNVFAVFWSTLEDKWCKSRLYIDPMLRCLLVSQEKEHNQLIF